MVSTPCAGREAARSRSRTAGRMLLGDSRRVRLQALRAALLPRRVHLRRARPGSRPREPADPRRDEPLPRNPRAAARCPGLAILLDHDGLSPRPGRERGDRLARSDSDLPAGALAEAERAVRLLLRSRD